MKNVPDAAPGWHECQWLQVLHSVGLLPTAFQPEQHIVAVRTRLRHLGGLVTASQHLQYAQVTDPKNLQIHPVISDLIKDRCPPAKRNRTG